MGNLQTRRETLFVNNAKLFEKSLLKPTLNSYQIVHNGLVSVSFAPSKIVWSKPTPVGAPILDLSKLSLDKFHYDQMKPRFSDKIKVGYKNRDSLLYRVETENLFSEIASFKHLLDPSDYPKGHFLHDKTNKKVQLSMKDEMQGKVLSEVVCF